MANTDKANEQAKAAASGILALLQGQGLTESQVATIELALLQMLKDKYSGVR